MKSPIQSVQSARNIYAKIERYKKRIFWFKVSVMIFFLQFSETENLMGWYVLELVLGVVLLLAKWETSRMRKRNRNKMFISFFSFEIYVRVWERETDRKESKWVKYTYIDWWWEKREKEGTEGGRKWQRESKVELGEGE